MITLKELKKDEEIQALIQVTEHQLEELGYTEHSNRHLSIVACWAGELMAQIGGTEKEIQMAEVAGYLHDIGNSVNRHDHAQSGALLAYQLLRARGVSYADAAEIMMAIGNHNEGEGEAVSRISAVLIIADKADVHRSRVRYALRKDPNLAVFDIHDRVNYAAESSHLVVDKDENRIVLEVQIDTTICPVMDYFEIYFGRMSMCRKAAEYLGMHFGLVINGAKLL